MRQKIRFLGVATTLLFLALAPAAHGATVFGVGGSLGSACNIFSIETSTGASTFLVDTGVTCALASGLTVTPNGLAYDFPSNRVYFSEMGIRLTQVAPISCGLGIFLGSVTG